jgi:CHAT domain-containing protein
MLANGQHLSVIDTMMLPLQDTDMVVMSACESALSADGMEYATLARALAQAGTPSILATLWQVPDAPSKELIEHFYDYARTDDRFTALAKAQRDMLKSGDPDLAKPGAWAGYIPFGRP